MFRGAYDKTPIIQGTYGGSATTTSTNTDSNNTSTETVTTPTTTETVTKPTTTQTSTTTTETSTTPTIVNNGTINNYYGDVTNNIIVDTTNNINVNNTTTIIKYGDTYTYNGGNKIINNYNSGEILSFAASYTDWTTDNNDLVINAAEGAVRITDANNKLVEVADANGNVNAHVYKADNYEGAINGRGYGAYEVITGSDNVSNQIFEAESGSSLWGGRGNSNDDLYGNLGIDEYIYSYDNGQDNIFQSGNEDTIHLLNISLNQISGAEIKDNGVNLKFTDGGSLNISGQVGTFALGSQHYGANYQSKSWYAK